MRAALWTLTIVLAGAWALCEWDRSRSSAPAIASYEWRRTTAGWERRPTWRFPDTMRPALHPLAMTSLQLALALMALSTAHGPLGRAG